MQRPKKMQAYLFMQAIDLIVQFGEEPELFFHQLKPLVIRHIKYGVKTEVSLDNLSGQRNFRLALGLTLVCSTLVLSSSRLSLNPDL
jgi:hypothetical protein